MTDRVIVYPSSIPQDTDILSTNRNAMIGLGRLAAATMGVNTIVDGLIATQTPFPTLQVSISPGVIMKNDVLDGQPYGSLSSSASLLYKLGITTDPTLLTLTPPTTNGFAINYLIEAKYTEVDTNPVVLPYYNAANPSQPFAGPTNSGNAQNTLRQQTVTFNVKAGAAAPTGTQVTPVPTGGYTPLYVVFVPAGTFSILNANITDYYTAIGNPAASPRIPYTLPELYNVAFKSDLRIQAQGLISLYVSPTGNDNNSGLSTAAPLATAQRAMNILATKYDGNNNPAFIWMMQGTHTATVTVTNTVGFSSISIQGRAAGSDTIATDSSVLWTRSSGGDAGIIMTESAGNATVFVAGLILQSTSACLFIANGAYLIIGPHIQFRASQSHINMVGGQVFCNSSYVIGGGGTNLYHIIARYNSLMLFDGTAGATINITNTPTFQGVFLYVTYSSTVQFIPPVFGGVFTGSTAIGTRFQVDFNSVLDTGTGNPFSVPGDSLFGATGTSFGGVFN